MTSAGESGAEHEGTSSQLSGTAHDVVQARDISGGIHFHSKVPATEHVPRQLPGDAHGFVNRVADLERLNALLTDGSNRLEGVPVCVITGTAGVGKTSLAVHWARHSRARFPDGQLYVNLRGYDPGEPVAPAQALGRFLEALGVAASAIPVDLEARAALYRSQLADKQILIVLDNAATVSQVRPLLAGADDGLVLITSRSRLSGLIARDGARRITLDIFPEAEAVKLLRSTMAEYRTADSDADIAELARLCAFLPLALRIAAERAAARPHMPLAALIADLRDESSLWDSLSSDDDDEADAVRSVFAWSYRALAEDVARMFRLLGLHPGADFSVLAAAALADIPAAKARRLLDSLVGAHLLEQTVHDRWYFHDLLRAYALELAATEETPVGRLAAVERVCLWYMHAMGTAAVIHDEFYADDWGVPVPSDVQSQLPVFQNHNEAMVWFSAETDNLVAAAKAASDTRLDEIAWKLPALLRTPYVDRHPADEWLPLGQAALSAARRAGDLLGEAITYIGLGVAYRSAQLVPEAVDAQRAALRAAREIGDRRQEAAALTLLGHAQRRGRQLDEACQSYQEGLAIADEARLILWTAWAMLGLAEALFDAARLDEARACLGEIAQQLPLERYPGLHAERLWVLASIERELGDTAAAIEHVGKALEIAHGTDNAQYIGEGETELGRAQLAAGQATDALITLQSAASIERRMGDRSREANALDATGEAYQALERFDEALPFHTRALALHRELDDRWRAAVALCNIGDAYRGTGTDSAERYYQEAVELISDYTDRRANALRIRLIANLGVDHT